MLFLCSCALLGCRFSRDPGLRWVFRGLRGLRDVAFAGGGGLCQGWLTYLPFRGRWADNLKLREGLGIVNRIDGVFELAEKGESIDERVSIRSCMHQRCCQKIGKQERTDIAQMQVGHSYRMSSRFKSIVTSTGGKGAIPQMLEFRSSLVRHPE